MLGEIKLVIFDCYGLVLNEGYPNTAKALAEHFGRTWKEYQQIMYFKYFNLAAVKKISQREAWLRTVRHFDLPLTWQQLRDRHYRLMKIDPRAVAFGREIEKHGVKVLLLSKNTRSQFADVCKRFSLKKRFTHVMNTWEYGLPKASAETIHFICRKFHVKPYEIAYIDDQRNNLVEPKKLGVHTLFHSDILSVTRRKILGMIG